MKKGKLKFLLDEWYLNGLIYKNMAKSLSLKKPAWGLHWFRRDLRICGNPSLLWNWQKANGNTLGLFCFDSQFLGRSDFSHNRFAFFIETLRALKFELRRQGGDLLVIDSPPLEGFKTIFDSILQQNKMLPSWITWNNDYEPFSRTRDQSVKDLLIEHYKVETHIERDHLVLEPHEVLTGGLPYKIFTPYYKKWKNRLFEPQIRHRIDKQSKQLKYFMANSIPNKKDPLDFEYPAEGPLENSLFKLTWNHFFSAEKIESFDKLEDFRVENGRSVTVPIPKAGSFEAFCKLKEGGRILPLYKEQRDFPGVRGTSRLSIFLKNGSLTTSQIIYQYNLLNCDNSSNETYLKELAWREFYYSILYHYPNVEKEEFISQYRQLKWRQDRQLFQRWCEGTTGYPIVDAGMRQLLRTGWIHNRVRMIVASFLTKHLLIDWRWGAEFFMKQLIDGDLAPNCGGWQWAASTGCDPQPYFRIFNPWLQSQKFDPNGDYIKQYIPELSSTPASLLHQESANRQSWGYPAPMVNHGRQRLAAIEFFKK